MHQSFVEHIHKWTHFKIYNTFRNALANCYNTRARIYFFDFYFYTIFGPRSRPWQKQLYETYESLLFYPLDKFSHQWAIFTGECSYQLHDTGCQKLHYFAHSFSLLHVTERQRSKEKQTVSIKYNPGEGVLTGVAPPLAFVCKVLLDSVVTRRLFLNCPWFYITSGNSQGLWPEKDEWGSYRYTIFLRWKNTQQAHSICFL